MVTLYDLRKYYGFTFQKLATKGILNVNEGNRIYLGLFQFISHTLHQYLVLKHPTLLCAKVTGIIKHQFWTLSCRWQVPLKKQPVCAEKWNQLLQLARRED